ncbi:MAG TPA: tetratricopeptide repeat protein [Polyangiaceae bacterium]|nr:tetratricopeptide repeat protein [Polyangiaceae bacterium]
MSNDSIEDKLVLARRGALSDPDRRRLEIALNTSASARALYEAGLAFDSMHTDRAGDRELLTRVGARISARVVGGQARKPRKLGKLVGFVGAMLFVSGAAAASLWHFGRANPASAGSSLITGPPGGGTTQRTRAQNAPATAATAADGAGRAPISTQAALPSEHRSALGGDAIHPSVKQGSLTPPESAHRDPPSSEDAASLFKDANGARKAGNSDRAVTLYQNLQRRFPASPEAQVSLVLSGRLLLASGQTGRALTLFEQYLKSGAPGGLAEEALSGKAEALAKLGRTDEERQVWRTLLRQFPHSVYVRKARERLR